MVSWVCHSPTPGVVAPVCSSNSWSGSEVIGLNWNSSWNCENRPDLCLNNWKCPPAGVWGNPVTSPQHNTGRQPGLVTPTDPCISITWVMGPVEKTSLWDPFEAGHGINLNFWTVRDICSLVRWYLYKLNLNFRRFFFTYAFSNVNQPASETWGNTLSQWSLFEQFTVQSLCAALSLQK